MELDLVQESWQELKRYINTLDRPDAAENLISVLIENGVAAEDIQSSFGNDSDIRKALNMYIEDTEEDLVEDLDFDDDD